jgi:hypothetical protein
MRGVEDAILRADESLATGKNDAKNDAQNVFAQ